MEHEQRIAELEAQVARLQRSVTVPKPDRVLGPRLEGLKILWIGPCHIEGLSVYASWVNCQSDHLGFISWPFEQLAPFDPAVYDGIVAGITLRYLFLTLPGEPRLDFYHLREDWNEENVPAYFEAMRAFMESHMRQIREKSADKPLFFMTFLEPSFNFAGQLIEDRSLTNISVFVSNMNREMRELAASFSNTYIIDINEAANAIGRYHLQDDVCSFYTHAGFIGDPDVAMDSQIGRIMPLTSPLEIYDIENKWRMFNEVVWDRLLDNLKIIRQVDIVKLIIVDLDDTLWRGIAAEPLPDGITDESYFRTIGWPMALAEGLLYFKQRGGLLAICSKNNREQTERNFEKLWGHRLRLSDFFSVKIGWEPKSELIAEILSDANVLPDAAVFIDDNPREISEVAQRFPQIRTLGFLHYDWRRMIMQLPETQVAVITNESRQRSELVKARVTREAVGATMDRTSWLSSLQLRAEFDIIRGTDAPSYARVFELLNKTNQFNTTGRRWKPEEIGALFARGGAVVAMTLRDAHADNGIVGLAVLDGDRIEQMVLSCRVFSLGAEDALLAHAVAEVRKGFSEVHAAIAETDKNLASRDIYQRNGFVGSVPGDSTLASGVAVASPAWISCAVI